MTEAQARALAHVGARASGAPLDRALRVTIHFHPDRLHRDAPILAAMRDAGVLRSQFETGTSNGGLSAFPGGDRHRWESRIFGGAYDDAPASERPKYGALNFRGRAHGASPRFGSAFFRLNEAALLRTTLCYPDSYFDPTHFGVAERAGLVAVAAADSVDRLDDYVEVQIHGEVSLARDVEALVLDPIHRGTPVDDLARELPCAIEYHPGFRLSIDVLRAHPTYRGPEIVALGEALAEDGWLTPKTLGDASRTGRYDPQALKRVWHYVARFGALGEPD